MNDQNELLGDDQLRGVAMATFHHHEAGVTPEETEAALRSVRGRIEAGQTGHDSWTSHPASGTNNPAAWMRIGAAAAVVALVAGGLVVLAGRDRGDQLDPIASPASTAAPATIPATTPATIEPVTTPASIPVTTFPQAAPATTVVPSAPSTTVPNQPVGGEALAIADNCVGDFLCTQLASTEDGRIVAYDPTDETLRVYDAAGQQLQTEVALAAPLAEQFPSLVHIGPDNVAYFAVDTPNFDDPSNDLVAIPLTGDRAGVDVMRYTGLDGTGDSSLVAQRAGLVSVGCCSGSGPRPRPDAAVYPFVDADGTPIESAAPTFRLDVGEAGNDLVRIDAAGAETLFNLPTVFQYPRDILILAATDDGGALGSDYIQLSSGAYSVVVRFRTDWPEGQIDNADVYLLDVNADGTTAFDPVLLERSGTVVVRDDAGRFVRRTLDEIGTPGWPGQFEVDVLDVQGNAEAPGLNDYITENQPSWAAAPDLLALQVVPTVGANESVQTEFAESAGTGTLTITTSGFLDDSTAASRYTVRTERGADGLLRVVGATYGWQCQPGRGHQDFTTEPCI